ncbi:GNAT family N-acetyltransferase [Phaeovulum sp.]|uniref:GNAT family N-acetyltransferase n=1 Tax=Phaeovulum sp. TaxID=2934796 RepID=UPI00272F6FE1|nr:GNAT family N-acetyltransferase [Phaeovulum sp.]
MPPESYSFREVTRADYLQLRRWLAEPHVIAAWGPVEEEIALIEAEIDGGDCAMHLVAANGTPIGFIQDWGVHEAGVPHFADRPPGTRATDTFLGATSHLGKGHAKAYVRRYAEMLRASGAPAVVTDPRPTNPCGVAMYRGAGFEAFDTRICEEGIPAICMQFRG